MPRPEAQTAFQKSLQVVFRALAHFKNQAHDSPMELNGIRIDMRQPCITFKNAEVSRCRTRQASQIVEPFAERQPTAKLHPIGIDHLKPIFPAAIFTIKNVSDIQILVQDARFMHAKQKSGQTFKYRGRLVTLRIHLHDRAQRLVIRKFRHEIAALQQSMAANLQKGNFSGRIDAEPAQTLRMTIGPFRLALAQETIYQTVDVRQVPISLDNIELAAGLKEFNRVASFPQDLSTPIKKTGRTSERTNDSDVEQFGEILILMEVLVCTKNYGAHTLLQYPFFMTKIGIFFEGPVSLFGCKLSGISSLDFSMHPAEESNNKPTDSL